MGEYHFAGFDEVCQLLEANYRYMFSRSRKLKGMQIPIRLRAASNPPGPGQGRWVYDRFVNSKTAKPGTIFIPAGLDDNPFLDKDEYLSALNELDPVTRAQLRDGNWTVQRSGNMFKEEWFDIVESIPAGARQVRFWDMASTVDPKKLTNRNKDPDYTCGAKVWEYQGIYYLENVVHGRWSSAETQNVQQSTAMADGVLCPIREEQEPGSSGDSAIELKSKFLLSKYNYRGIRSSGSKIQRAEYASTMAEKRRIKILAPFAKTEKWQDLISELTGFPEADHDDFVDAFSGAINYLAEGINNDVPPQIITESSQQTSYWETQRGGIDQVEYMQTILQENGQFRESFLETESYWKDIT